jgi:hypothetical protein
VGIPAVVVATLTVKVMAVPWFALPVDELSLVSVAARATVSVPGTLTIA